MEPSSKKASYDQHCSAKYQRRKRLGNRYWRGGVVVMVVAIIGARSRWLEPESRERRDQPTGK
jgi:hypothetical protein